MRNYFFYENNFCPITLLEEDGFITNLWMNKKELDENLFESEVIKKCYKQIDEYFLGKRKKFTVKIKPNGTEYFKKVWDELIKIPYGEVRTYKNIAENVGNKNAARAVGLANNKNPIPIIIPCHRVIGSNNKLVGFAYGLFVKQKLIDHEKENL